MNVLSYLRNPANWSGSGEIPTLLLQHLAYTASAVLLAAVVAVPAGILIGRSGRRSTLVTGLSTGVRAIPSLGLLFLAVMLLGTGTANIVVVLAVLAVPPILTAVAAGVSGADREAVGAARAMGMTDLQVLARVQWPLALPLVVSGLRSATVQVVATATVAAFASGGGLGRLLTDGQQQDDYPQMFAGAVLVAGLAVVADLALGGLGWCATRRARPRSTPAAAPAFAPA